MGPYCFAFFHSRIDEGIKNNRLVTDGIYAWCRWLRILPFIFSLLMAIMMKLTEEKWLRCRI